MREVHEKAFDLTRSFIMDKILQKEEVHKVTDLHQQYLYWLEELDPNETIQENERTYIPHHLVEKVQPEFGELVQFVQHSSRPIGKIVFKSTMSVEKL